MPSMEIVVKTVTEKRSGETNGTKWTLFEVEADTKTGGVQRFTTFDSGWQLQVGRILTVPYTVKQNGKFTNFSLGDAPTNGRHTAPPTPAVSPAPPSMDAKYVSLSAKLDEVLQIVKELRSKFA